MDGFVSTVEQVNNAVNGFVWGLPMLILLVGTGILIAVRPDVSGSLAGTGKTACFRHHFLCHRAALGTCEIIVEGQGIAIIIETACPTCYCSGHNARYNR